MDRIGTFARKGSPDTGERGVSWPMISLPRPSRACRFVLPAVIGATGKADAMLLSSVRQARLRVNAVSTMYTGPPSLVCAPDIERPIRGAETARQAAPTAGPGAVDGWSAEQRRQRACTHEGDDMTPIHTTRRCARLLSLAESCELIKAAELGIDAE